MSRARHHHKMHKAKGGSVYYEGGESNVAKEAAEKEQRKHGGKVMGKVHGAKSKHRLDRRARGGKVEDMKQDKKMVAAGVHKHEKHMHKGEPETHLKRGGKVHKHHPHKAHGGRVGSDKSPLAPGSARHPFSSAAR